MARTFAITLISVIALTVAFAVPVFAGEADALAGVLPDLPGWKAQKAQPVSMDMGGFKFTTVTRHYKKSDKSLSVAILVGNKIMTASKIKEMNISTDQGSAESKKIDGFNVTTSFAKKTNSRAIIVYLGEGANMGAMLTLAFERLTKDEALETAKKLDWKKIKAETDKLIK